MYPPRATSRSGAAGGTRSCLDAAGQRSPSPANSSLAPCFSTPNLNYDLTPQHLLRCASRCQLRLTAPTPRLAFADLNRRLVACFFQAIFVGAPGGRNANHRRRGTPDKTPRGQVLSEADVPSTEAPVHRCHVCLGTLGLRRCTTCRTHARDRGVNPRGLGQRLPGHGPFKVAPISLRAILFGSIDRLALGVQRPPRLTVRFRLRYRASG